jgi:hypothetical protein
MLYCTGVFLSGDETEMLYCTGVFLSGDETEMLYCTGVFLSGDKTEMLYCTGVFLSGDKTEMLYCTGAYLSGDETEMLYCTYKPTSFISPMQTEFLVHLIFLDLTILIIFGEQNKLWSSSLRSFLHSPVTSKDHMLTKRYFTVS